MNREIAYLYRSYNPKMATYETDGCGRDTYISCDNGGMVKVPAKEMRPATNQYSLNRNYHFYHIKRDAPILKYRSDGSGRDSYISDRNGGLSYDSNPICGVKLSDFLRNHSKSTFQVKKKKDPTKPLYVTKKQKLMIDEQKLMERRLITRLYSNRDFSKHKCETCTNFFPEHRHTSGNESNSLPMPTAASMTRLQTVNNANTNEQDPQPEANQLPNIVATEPNLQMKKTFSAMNFNKLMNKVDKINHYEDSKKKYRNEQNLLMPERTKFFFDYLNKIKK